MIRGINVNIHDLLKKSIELGASDIHITINTNSKSKRFFRKLIRNSINKRTHTSYDKRNSRRKEL